MTATHANGSSPETTPLAHANGSSSSTDATAPGQRRKILGFLRLEENVTVLNFVAYLLAACFTVCFFVFINASQGFVLGQIINVPETELGTNAGSLSFYDELLSIVMVWVWGLASDIIGRRTVYSLGYLFMALGLFIFTYAKNIYPELLLFRLIFAVGGAAGSSMLTAVLADYAGEEDRGKVSAIVGLMTGAGALLALFVFLRIPSSTADPVGGLRRAYFIVGGIAAVFGVALFFTLNRTFGSALTPTPAHKLSNGTTDPDATQQNLSSPRTSDAGPDAQSATSATGIVVEKTDVSESVPQRRRPLWVLAREGFAAARDPVILVGYLGGFLARADSVVVTTFLPLWVYKYYIQNGLCSATDPNDPDIRETCRQAYVLSSTLSGVSQTLTLVGAPLYGWLIDSSYRPLAVLIAAIIGLVGYMLVAAIPNPAAGIAYLSVSLVGLSEIGMIVGSLALVTGRYVPSDVRGSVAGVYSLCGAAGILVTSKLGGTLFDTWVPVAPFVILAIARAIITPIVLYVVVRDVMAIVKSRNAADAEAASEAGSSTNGSADRPSRKKNGVLSVLKQRFLEKELIGGTSGR